MDVRPLPPEEAAVRRCVEALWLPYNRELEATVDRHVLADVDYVAEEVPFRLEKLESEDYEALVAVDGADEGDPIETLADDAFAGFVAVEMDEAPSVFDRPGHLRIRDVYVREPYRGTGLARELLDHAAERAREEGCAELALDVDVDNERAIAFYEKLGFEPYRKQMAIAVDELQ